MKIERLLSADRRAPFPVAVVGLHGRFPGATDVRAFWDNLHEGRDTITKVPADRWSWEALFGEPDDATEQTYANTGAFAPHVDCFDCRFFNILPREAESMDPQQRLFLQTAWAALEDAGYALKGLAGRPVGVFVGVGYGDYRVLIRRDNAPFDVFRGTGVALTAIPNRVSFTLDLRGPSEAIDTACSGSLVAIHRAIQSLEFGECELAIAGGVSLLLEPELFIAFAKAGMLSRVGRCRPFDAAGDGYVRGEGVAALVLRPLQAAEANGDFIYGVIRGSAENHGGKTHSFTAPSVSAQADVISQAWSRAGRSIWDASLIETHGTGTPLGDPIEVKGLKKAFEDAKSGLERRRVGQRSVALGALKSHVGHLEAAAGIAGVVKTLLSMHHGVIPPNLHYREKNPQINFDDTPFYIPVKPIQLEENPDGGPLAGVSSFGFGGSNAHVVIEAYRRPKAPREHPKREPDAERSYLIPISARNEHALLGRVRQLIDYLEAGGDSETSARGASIELVSEALDLGALPRECGQINLSSLGISVEQLLLALKRLGAATGRPIGLKDVRECMTLEELAERISRVSGAGSSQRFAEGELLLSRVALPSDMLRRVSLAELSYSLMHGRDAMDERLAVVTDSKQTVVEKLRRFLAEPNHQEGGCLRGTVRSQQGDAAIEPAKPSSTPTAEMLEEWGRYWVSCRTAKLQWDVLHQGRVPRKVPMPAYPFQLARIWYKARQQAPPATPLVERTDHLARSPQLEEGWTPYWKRSPVAVPSSVVGLACLLEHFVAKGDDDVVRLTDVEFGRPLHLEQEALACRTGDGGQPGIIQCLYEGGSMPQVLVQARVAQEAGTAVHAASSFRADMKALRSSTFYDVAAERGVPVAPEFRCVDDVEVAGRVVLMKARLSRRKINDASFWSSLFATILAGSAYLLEKVGVARSDAPTPYRAATLIFDPRASQTLTEIVIERDAADGTMHVIASGVEGGRVLELRGLQLRRSAARAHAEAATAPSVREVMAS